jgi:hypothetical protein
MTQVAHFQIICKTASSTNKKPHVVECEYINTVVNGRNVTVYHVAGVRCETHAQFIAARNGKPTWPPQALVLSVRKIEHHDVVS